MNTAVLFLVFNRPKTSCKVFEAIRQARPPRLYVAADGPREHVIGESERCTEVRNIVTSIDWPCEVKTLFRKENLGCRIGVSTAIDWFFENELDGIILEDDCYPDQSFFRFSEELLERYREDLRVMVISGSYFHGKAHKSQNSYFFSRYNHCWGWATWKRAWQLYDRDMSQWPKLRDSNWMNQVSNGNRSFIDYWKNIFEYAYIGKIDSWAYRWTFSCWAYSGLTVLPVKNLVRNIGFNEYATHTKNKNKVIENLRLEKIEFPLNHPSDVKRNVAEDKWTDKYVFGITLLRRFKVKLKELIITSD